MTSYQHDPYWFATNFEYPELDSPSRNDAHMPNTSQLLSLRGKYEGATAVPASSSMAVHPNMDIDTVASSNNPPCFTSSPISALTLFPEPQSYDDLTWGIEEMTPFVESSETYDYGAAEKRPSVSSETTPTIHDRTQYIQTDEEFLRSNLIGSSRNDEAGFPGVTAIPQAEPQTIGISSNTDYIPPYMTPMAIKARELILGCELSNVQSRETTGAASTSTNGKKRRPLYQDPSTRG